MLAEIPFDRQVAQAYSQGRRLTSLRRNWERMLLKVYIHFLRELVLENEFSTMAKVSR